MAQNQYMLRFDDICPTMNWEVWEAIERNLILHGIRPMLAVVPDNQDKGLMIDPPAEDFWERVRDWQRRGYAIALHGYQHVYINRERGLMRLTAHSEFTGLPYEVQAEKLEKGMAIFAKHGIRADAWIAPSHSFDRNTLAVLDKLGLRTVCDGLWPWPHKDEDGIFWVPQQLWRFAPKSSGIWTVCCHHNQWSPEKVKSFSEELVHYGPRMTDLETVIAEYSERPLTVPDQASALCNLIWEHRVLPALGRWRRRIFNVRPKV